MIDAEHYLNRLVGIYMQFDVAFGVIEGFQDSSEAVEKYLDKQLQRMRTTITEAAKASGFDPKKHPMFSHGESRKFLQWAKGDLPQRIGDVVNRLRQNQLVLLVAVFESFMKDIHREILRQNPRLLKADRQIPLGKVVSTGKDEILEEEIEREVQSLDRKSTDKRWEYFDNHLNIDWFGGTIVPLLKRVLDLRNKILHEDPEVEVTEDDLQLAHVVCLSLPVVCILQAAVLYPHGFKGGENVELDGFRELMKEQGRIKPD